MVGRLLSGARVLPFCCWLPIGCGPSPPGRVSSCSRCTAGPSTAVPHAAAVCAVGRRCRTGHSSAGSSATPCRHQKNDTGGARSKWGCGTCGRCCQTGGWTGSLSFAFKVRNNKRDYRIIITEIVNIWFNIILYWLIVAMNREARSNRVYWIDLFFFF